MSKRALAVILGFLALSLPVLAQEEALLKQAANAESPEALPGLSLARADFVRDTDSAALVQSLPVLTHLEGQRFTFSPELAHARTRRSDVLFLALSSRTEAKNVSTSSTAQKDTPRGLPDLRSNGIYTSGEIGFRYGRSTGRYGHEDYSAYLLGTVGNEKFSITAGASFQESNGRYPHH